MHVKIVVPVLAGVVVMVVVVVGGAVVVVVGGAVVVVVGGAVVVEVSVVVATVVLGVDTVLVLGIVVVTGTVLVIAAERKRNDSFRICIVSLKFPNVILRGHDGKDSGATQAEIDGSKIPLPGHVCVIESEEV